MWLFLSVLALCATALVVTRDLVRSGFLSRPGPIAATQDTVSDEGTIPPDLMASNVNSFREDWARADAAAYLLELRLKTGSWDGVRKTLVQE